MEAPPQAESQRPACGHATPDGPAPALGVYGLQALGGCAQGIGRRRVEPVLVQGLQQGALVLPGVGLTTRVGIKACTQPLGLFGRQLAVHQGMQLCIVREGSG